MTSPNTIEDNAGDPFWVEVLLKDLLPPQVIAQAATEYDTVATTPLRVLGLDSLALAELIERVETFAGEEIDLETFDIGVLATMSTLRSYLDRVGGGTEASP